MSKYYEKLYKKALSFVMAFVIMAATVAVSTKQADASVIITIATTVARAAITVGDRALIAGLNRLANKTGNETFVTIGNVLVLPKDRSSRQITQLCEEILAKLEAMSNDLNAIDQAIESSIYELGQKVDSANLNNSRGKISGVMARCDLVTEKYTNYLEYLKVYADAVTADETNPTEATKKAVADADVKLRAALELFEESAKKFDFEEALQQLVDASCKYNISYNSATHAATKGAENKGNKDLALANIWANDVFAFEHQKHEFLTNEANWAASAFLTLSSVSGMYTDYLEAQGSLTEKQRQFSETIANKCVQGVNDIAEQCEGYTKKLMQPYDVDKQVEMVYTASRDYSQICTWGWKPTNFQLQLKAYDTARYMNFYNVKPINKDYPFLILKNGEKGPKTIYHWVAFDRDPDKDDSSGNFSTMDLDFYNLVDTNDKVYKMPYSASELSDLFSTSAYNLSGSNVAKYLTEQGGLDPQKLNKEMTITPLRNWSDVGYQLFNFSDFYSYYYFTKLAGFNPTTPSKFEMERRADKHYNDGMLVVLKQAGKPEYKIGAESNKGADIELKGISKSINAPGTQVTVVYSAGDPNVKGLGLMNDDGRVIEVLVDPDNYDFLKDKNGKLELTFYSPYQNIRVVPVERETADEVYARNGKSVSSGDKMSFDRSDNSGPARLDKTPDAQTNAANQLSIVLTKTEAIPEFSDIQHNPAKDDIEFLASYGVVSGMGGGKFSPDLTMTRGMFVTALSRLTDIDMSAYKSSNFSDVSTKSWLRPYVEWAYKNGLISGQGDWEFKPDEPLTREQMAVILAAFLDKVGPPPASRGDPQHFSDSGQISEWAKDAVSIVCSKGVMNAEGERFNPKVGMTRAEVASTFASLIRVIEKGE